MIDDNDDQDYQECLPDFEAWFDKGIEQGATYMFVVHDNTDSGPVYVESLDDFREVERRCWIAGHITNLYDLSQPFKQQTGEYH